SVGRQGNARDALAAPAVKSSIGPSPLLTHDDKEKYIMLSRSHSARRQLSMLK
ncbi:hypothetical protein NDU88_007218, partial [Pleurodeles waltl]